MKVLATIQLLVTLLTATTAVESVRGARQLHETAAVTVAAASSASTTSKKVTAFPRIKLLPGNEISPFIGVPSAFGIAQVTLDYNHSRTSAKWKVCIKTTVLGFSPGLLHIHKGKLSENGGVVADFSSMLKQDAFFDGCVVISQATYDDIRLYPVRKLRAVPTIASPAWHGCCMILIVADNYFTPLCSICFM